MKRKNRCSIDLRLSSVAEVTVNVVRVLIKSLQDYSKSIRSKRKENEK